MSARFDELIDSSPISVEGTVESDLQRDRAIASAAANPVWRATHVEALQLGGALEQDVEARWPERVRCLHVHSEIGNVVIFFAGEEALRDAVMSLVPQSTSLRAHYILLDARGRRLQRGVAKADPREHDGLREAERQFINFLIEQALQQWTHGI
jgi:hypothetical protein